MYVYANREKETHTQQVSYEVTYLREAVFFRLSSDVYRGQKEQTKNNDYIHNRAGRQYYRLNSEEKGKKTGSRKYVTSYETCCVCVSLSLSFPISTTFIQLLLYL